jgi:hypothetical protein
MNNTTVMIKFKDGLIRRFEVSDEMESHIATGEMINITTVHPEHDHQEGDASLSKVYLGSPISALGNMIIMRQNAENLDEDEHPGLITNVLDHCIAMLKNEINTHNTGMSDVSALRESGMNLAFDVFMPVIEYAIGCNDPQMFLTYWVEGDLVTIANEWSDFEIPAAILREPPAADQKPRLSVVDNGASDYE